MEGYRPWSCSGKFDLLAISVGDSERLRHSRCVCSAPRSRERNDQIEKSLFLQILEHAKNAQSSDEALSFLALQGMTEKRSLSGILDRE